MSSMLPNVLYILGKGDLRAVFIFLSLSLGEPYVCGGCQPVYVTQCVIYYR